MNYDLLIKLAKLANHNPNENEANAAARKVCKLIQENNYKFDNPPQQTQQPRQGGYNSSTPWESDWFKNFYRQATSYEYEYYKEPPKTWNDVHRSEEPFWRSKQDPWMDIDFDILSFARREHKRQKNEKRKSYKEPIDYTCKACGSRMSWSHGTYFEYCIKCIFDDVKYSKMREEL